MVFLFFPAKETDFGNTSLYGNRALIQIGGQGQSRRWRDYRMSKSDFQIPHRNLPFFDQITQVFRFLQWSHRLVLRRMKTLLFFARRVPAMLLRAPLTPPAGGDMIGGGCAGEIFLLFWFFLLTFDLELNIVAQSR
jgi:hypothetical protein